MAYDPLPRGPLPVGVETVTLVDPARGDRAVHTEVWFPATDAATGLDLGTHSRDHYELMPGVSGGWQLAARGVEARDGSFPLVAFSHGWGAHRRQSTFFCTHLASHGYVVIAPDHAGNTVAEMLASALGGDAAAAAPMGTPIVDRPPDIRLCIDAALAHGIAPIAGQVDASCIGMAGHSFGGWTTLAATSADDRIRAIVPLAPAGGSSSLTDATTLREAIAFDKLADVPVLVMAAELDSVLPLHDMRRVYDPIAGPKRFVVLLGADHMHFCDRVEQLHEMFRMLPQTGGIPRAHGMRPIDQLCPGQHGYDMVTSLGLAHFDAHLRGDDDAAAYLAGPWRDALTARGLSFSTW